ncbi:DEAD/DEAH box helicase [Anaerobacillus alkaliphilus]|uniref:DEAD/DEAH box helicase n=1 Tax=Anaerobacillus alkaliphilus TaxID=1548597 RepID=A0A4Q0VY06_9BACI|nr:DEAD/DEAH box helicase [Anaerobacillus alkaliphilus]RXJ04643.1 DEAD/DEAH box helicase [Anaerobacillus alkaliphilus]
MNRIENLYPIAVERTKTKVLEDIDRFLETHEVAPDFKDYKKERYKYLGEIWFNIWLNLTNNDVPRKEKKRLLSENGYEVENVDKKLINKLFRNEMMLFSPFDVVDWLVVQFENDSDRWKQRHPVARANFLKRLEEERLAQKKHVLYDQIELVATESIDEEYDTFYLFVRNFVSSILVKDLRENSKYSQVEAYKIEEKLVEQGKFDASKYSTMETFFQELTGAVHKMYRWEYETYSYRYVALIDEYVSEIVSNWVLGKLPSTVLEEFEQLTGLKLTENVLTEILDDYITALQSDYFLKIEEEYIEDLLKLVDIPFDLDDHEQVYEDDLRNRERRKQEELAEIERKKAEEARMLDDIFGREYSPSTGRNIRYVLHIGETNTGKTHHALNEMKKADTGLYLAPLRLLALEVFDKLNKEGVPCGLKTGEEEKEVEGASHLACTVEMFHEKSFFDIIVIDEAQMIADKDRGFSWYKAITKANAREVHIIGSWNAREMIVELLGNSKIEIHEYYRDIPLVVEKKEFNIKHTKKGDALVCFSRRRVLETASKLENDGHSVSMIYGSMPPETRKKQIQRFNTGETKVIVATDAIGMGLNLPIRRIVFLENEKFDGTRRRRLTSQEVKQIAGRAGRKGIYDTGKVAFTKDIRTMERLLEQEDVLISTFAIAPTNSIFERFQKYYRDLSKFFEMWYKFESPKGTKKASLSEERELYATIRDTEVEGRLSMMDLYGFLHLPFSKKDPELIKQWRDTMFAIVRGKDLPEPVIKRGTLEELELSYKTLGLHLLFLYRLNRGTEAIYWERLRQEISDHVHERLKTDVKALTKKCKSCGKILPWDFIFPICDACHAQKKRRSYYEEY